MPSYKNYFLWKIIELVSNLVFTMELIMRFVLADSWKEIYGEVFNYFDFLAVLPFWLRSITGGGESVTTSARRSSIALSCHVTPIAPRHASLIVPTAIPVPTSTGVSATLSTTTPTSISRKAAATLPSLLCATPFMTRR